MAYAPKKLIFLWCIGNQITLSSRSRAFIYAAVLYALLFLAVFILKAANGFSIS